jgi:hypothetical protein
VRGYKRLELIKSDDPEWFVKQVTRISGEFQNNGWGIELDYKPVVSPMQNIIVYTCLIKAYEEK